MQVVWNDDKLVLEELIYICIGKMKEDEEYDNYGRTVG